MGQPTATQARKTTFDLLSLPVGGTATIKAFKGVTWYITRLADTYTHGDTLIGVSVVTTNKTVRAGQVAPSDARIGRYVTKSGDVDLGQIGKIEAVKSVKVGSKVIFI